MTKQRQHSDEPPSAKRSRVSRACDQCRASRGKCDGAQPDCSSCVNQSRPCTYNEQPKKRGIQPNYIRTLELLLACLTQSSPDSVLKLTQSLPQSDDPITRLLIAKDTDASEELHQVWRNGALCRQIDQLLSGSTVEVVDSSEIFAQSTAAHFRLPSTPQDKAPQWPSTSTTFRPAEDTRDERLQLPGNAWRYLEYYFAFTHAWMPLTEKTEILKLMYAYPAAGLSKAKRSTPEYAELWAIMAIAEMQLSSRSIADEDFAALHVAQSLIPKETHLLTPGYAKALLLHALIDFTRRRWLSVWLLIGSVIRLVYYERVVPTLSLGRGHLLSATDSDIGPNSTHTPQSSSVPSSSMGDSIILAAFVIESAVAYEAKLPALFGPNMIALLEPLREDGPEEWTPWQDPLTSTSSRSPTRACSALNALTRRYIQINSQVVPRDTTASGLVTRLAQNALTSIGNERLQPFALISRNATSELIDAAHSPPTRAIESLSASQLGFGSVPQGPDSSSTFEDSSIISQSAGTNLDLLVGHDAVVPSHIANVPGASLEFDDMHSGASIFDELALLEKTDSSQHPEFLRNLGFGPDIDLAEFFGTDYQTSDPLLAYVQPNFATVPPDDVTRLDGG